MCKNSASLLLGSLFVSQLAVAQDVYITMTKTHGFEGCVVKEEPGYVHTKDARVEDLSPSGGGEWSCDMRLPESRYESCSLSGQRSYLAAQMGCEVKKALIGGALKADQQKVMWAFNSEVKPISGIAPGRAFVQCTFICEKR